MKKGALHATPPYFNYDKEWIELIKEAKSIGLTHKDIREFLITQTKKDLAENQS